MKLYLIRHGQTDWNIQGKIQGRYDIPLNETGLWQAECLAQGMERHPVKYIYTSVQTRAVQTAEAIGRIQGVKVVKIVGLEEVEFGKWEGLTWSEIEDRYPHEFQSWCADPSAVNPPGAETREEVYSRCRTVLDKILSVTDGDTAIISHGATLAYVLCCLLKNQMGGHEEVIVKNASITMVHYNTLTEEAVLEIINDTSHLEKRD